MINIFKVGGNVIDNPDMLVPFLRRFKNIPGRKILVHGGGKEATRLSEQLGVTTTMVEGRRVTDRETLDIVTMVYAGLVNKRIVARLQGLGCDAVGFTGVDGNMIKAVRRPAAPIDYGYVGDISPKDINTRLILSLTDEGYVPVFCAISHDGSGTLLNCNADSVAAALAKSLSTVDRVALTYCFEKSGVLADPEDDRSVIPSLTPADFVALKESGTISKGMIPKLQNAVDCVEAGVGIVRICKAEDINGQGGTIIREN